MMCACVPELYTMYMFEKMNELKINVQMRIPLSPPTRHFEEKPIPLGLWHCSQKAASFSFF